MQNNNIDFSKYKTYSAGHLLFLAKQAYKRTMGDTERTSGKSDAIVAIVFSASALEAFINELVDLAFDFLDLNQEPESVTIFIKLLQEIEISRGSIQLKFMTTKFVFSGDSYEKGEPPFQDMVRLFAVRNALVHLKPQEEFSKTLSGKIIRIKETKVIKMLPNNILAEFDEEIPADWKALISTQATAKWACNTAVNMVHSVLSVLPEGSFKKMAQNVFGSSFQSV